MVIYIVMYIVDKEDYCRFSILNLKLWLTTAKKFFCHFFEIFKKSSHFFEQVGRSGNDRCLKWILKKISESEK